MKEVPSRNITFHISLMYDVNINIDLYLHELMHWAGTIYLVDWILHE